jgi:hypothetical protein
LVATVVFVDGGDAYLVISAAHAQEKAMAFFTRFTSGFFVLVFPGFPPIFLTHLAFFVGLLDSSSSHDYIRIEVIMIYTYGCSDDDIHIWLQ